LAYREIEGCLSLLPVNVCSDYLSLFVIRPLLIRSGTKPVIGLALGAVCGAAIVFGANVLRWLVTPCALQAFETTQTTPLLVFYACFITNTLYELPLLLVRP
jgi:hypothetical protein